MLQLPVEIKPECTNWAFHQSVPKAELVTSEAKNLQNSEYLQASLACFLVFMAILGALRNSDPSFTSFPTDLCYCATEQFVQLAVYGSIISSLLSFKLQFSKAEFLIQALQGTQPMVSIGLPLQVMLVPSSVVFLCMRVVLEESGEGHHKKYRWKEAARFILQCQGPQCFLCAFTCFWFSFHSCRYTVTALKQAKFLLVQN